jgi:hypothetical protein
MQDKLSPAQAAESKMGERTAKAETRTRKRVKIERDSKGQVIALEEENGLQ